MGDDRSVDGGEASGKSLTSNSNPPGSPRTVKEELTKAIEELGKDLDRLIVVRPSREDESTYLEKLFESAGRPVPHALRGWEARVDGWCDDYSEQYASASILEVNLEIAVYIFDQSFERVLLAYGISNPQLEARDKNRMRRFPDVNVGVKAAMGDDAFLADRGHFLGHASGGVLDINLFPQRRELNRGWSPEGKLFRSMERHAVAHLGTFLYHRATYNDETWIPDKLEYGLLLDDKDWWIEAFRNK